MTGIQTAAPTDDWQLPTDDDDRAELASVGIILPSHDASVQFPSDAAQLDAAIGTLLRQLARTELDLDRFKRACAKEHEVVTARYERIMEPLQKRAGWLASVGRQMAHDAEFPGKSKSRSTAWGSYGRKKKAAHLFIEDGAALLAWAELNQPAIVDVKETRRVLQAGAVAYFESTGEVPPGCSFDAEHEESFVKPDLIAVATEVAS
jgi:hypothetical protein